MSHDSALRDPARPAVRYKALAMAFGYPDDASLGIFEVPAADRAAIVAEYDRLFRAGRVWLEGAEYTVENEFQRVRLLADVMAFYRAFGVEPALNRPDALSCEMEFMHCLEVKRERAVRDPANAAEKAAICLDAEAKFFAEHLAPAGRAIASRLREETVHPFYREAGADLEDFMNSESVRLGAPSVISSQTEDAGARGCAAGECEDGG